MLRRSPDPEEVQAEMRQDKGYGGKKRKINDVVVSGSEKACSLGMDEEGSDTNSEQSVHPDGDSPNIGSGKVNQMIYSGIGGKMSMEGMKCVKKL